MTLKLHQSSANAASERHSNFQKVHGAWSDVAARKQNYAPKPTCGSSHVGGDLLICPKKTNEGGRSTDDGISERDSGRFCKTRTHQRLSVSSRRHSSPAGITENIPATYGSFSTPHCDNKLSHLTIKKQQQMTTTYTVQSLFNGWLFSLCVCGDWLLMIGSVCICYLNDLTYFIWY